jgi:hypothetical protein
MDRGWFRRRDRSEGRSIVRRERAKENGLKAGQAASLAI